MNKTEQQLTELIERYFEGSTTIAEERQLRHLLADSSIDTPLANEARAVMGYSLAKPQLQAKLAQRKPVHTWLNVAACLAVLIGISSVCYVSNQRHSDECIAYLNGKEISNQQVVTNMMLSDIADVADANADLEAEIAESWSDEFFRAE